MKIKIGYVGTGSRACAFALNLNQMRRCSGYIHAPNA